MHYYSFMMRLESFILMTIYFWWFDVMMSKTCYVSESKSSSPEIFFFATRHCSFLELMTPYFIFHPAQHIYNLWMKKRILTTKNALSEWKWLIMKSFLLFRWFDFAMKLNNIPLREKYGMNHDRTYAVCMKNLVFGFYVAVKNKLCMLKCMLWFHEYGRQCHFLSSHNCRSTFLFDTLAAKINSTMLSHPVCNESIITDLSTIPSSNFLDVIDQAFVLTFIEEH